MRARFLFISLAAALVISSIASAQDITVRPGDSLWALAARHGTTVAALKQANGLASNALRPGDTLTLPTGSVSTPTTYVVAQGDTLYDIAVAFDMTVDDLIAFNDLDGIVIRPGMELQLGAGTSTPTALTVTIGAGDTLWALSRAYDLSIADIAAANGIDAQAVLQPGQALVIPGRYGSTEVDTGGASTPEVQVQPGDTLWEIARRYNTTVSALMAANGLAHDALQAGQTLRVVGGSDLVRAQPATADPAPQPSVTMVWPLAGRITSRFGYRSLRVGGSNMHYGLDIDGDTGDPIASATGGIVSFSGWMGGYGNLVVITDGNTEYYYAHASALMVVEGETVTPGQVLAAVGSTGNSTGSHLHFEVRVDGSPIDPMPLLELHAAR